MLPPRSSSKITGGQCHLCIKNTQKCVYPIFATYLARRRWVIPTPIINKDNGGRYQDMMTDCEFSCLLSH